MGKKLILAPAFMLAIALLWAVSFGTGTDQAVASGSEQISLTSGPAESSGDGVWKAPAGSRAIVWDNGMDDCQSALVAAQYDSDIDLDPLPADDFMFAVDQLVNDVHWIGGYWNGPPDDGDFDWEIVFYDDIGDGTKPGTAIATYYFPNANVNETWLSGVAGGSNFYSYSVNLPSTMTFAAGAKYWISIQGIGIYPPQSGWAYHDTPIQLHEAVFKSVYFGWPDWTDATVVFGGPFDLCFQLTYEEPCEWNPGDPHKMHFPQLPDEFGWDVNATAPVVLAEDWRCSQTGWIKDFHFWGSWKHDDVGQILYFVLSIHADIPADPPQIPYSRPGITLWETEATAQIVPFDPPSMEGWYDPSTGEVIFNDHQAYFRYDVCLDEQFWFHQERDTIYWLNISAVVADPQNTQWGWKSTLDRWNDDAVWAFWGELDWIEMYEPSDPIYNFWEISLDPAGNFMSGWGSDAYDDPTAPGYLENGWYQYPSGWYNIWFYDHPLDMTAWKDAWGNFLVAQPIEPGQPMYLTMAVNWATDVWSLEFPNEMPPLPGVDEELYIGREIIYDGYVEPGMVIPWEWHFPDYNPEWISIDVMGYNFWIDQGNLWHDCRASMNLAFVVTGPDEMPCDCLPGDADGNGLYEISDAVWIIAYVFTPGSPAPTPYAVCSGDADCNCIVEISDAVWMINYVFVPGSPTPCDCLTWLNFCGPPLYK